MWNCAYLHPTEPDVVEILPAAIANIENDHGVKFLRDGCFARVSANERSFHRKKKRKGSELNVGTKRVAETDVNLHRNPCFGQVRVEFDAHPIVSIITFNSGDVD